MRARLVAPLWELLRVQLPGHAHGEEDPLIADHPEYKALGLTPQERQYAYRELFQQRLDDNEQHDVREALNQCLVLGRDCFKDEIEQ